MKNLKNFVYLTVFLFVIWLILTPHQKDEFIFGAIASIMISLIFLGVSNVYSDFKLTPRAIIYSIIYFFVFLRELIKSNLDVAARVVNPKMPINPGIVKVKTKLKSRIGRIMLANSITLTPGTLTVETNGEFYYIHWIDVKGKDVESASKEIVATFEKYLEVMFG